MRNCVVISTTSSTRQQAHSGRRGIDKVTREEWENNANANAWRFLFAPPCLEGRHVVVRLLRTLYSSSCYKTSGSVPHSGRDKEAGMGSRSGGGDEIGERKQMKGEDGIFIFILKR